MTAHASAASVPQAERARPAIRRAGRVVAIGLLIGLAAQLLFFDVGIGINVPIGVALLLAAGWVTRRPGARAARTDVWLGPAALAFAVFAAIRADATIVALDVLTALGLTGMTLVSLGGQPVVRSALSVVLGRALAAVGWLTTGAFTAIADARRALPRGALDADRARPAIPVLRGLLIAAPVVAIFVGLFSSADAVFASVVDGIVGVELDIGDLPGRLVFAAGAAWLAIGLLAMTAGVAPAEEEPSAGGTPPTWRIGATEAVTVLIAVVVVFVFFVGLQAAYLFGGLDTLAVTGLSYAEYARRGFFELVAVAILAGGLVVAIDRLGARRTRPTVTAGMAVAVLTGVVLVSAAFRMRLYQEAYGWTELRLYVLATIVLLGMLLVALVAALATDRVRWMGHAVIVGGLAVGLALNVIGPVRFITDQNVARVIDPSLVAEHGTAGLDVAYLGSLDMDAVPGLLRVLPSIERTQALVLRAQLEDRLADLRRSPDAWQAWNAGRAAAMDALASAEERGNLDRN